MQELIFLNQDTIQKTHEERNQINAEVSTTSKTKDSIIFKKVKTSNIASDSVSQKTKHSNVRLTAHDSTTKIITTIYNPYSKVFNSGDNFLLYNQLSKNMRQPMLHKNQNYIIQFKPTQKIKMYERTHFTSNWVFFVLIFLILIFIWIKIFYSKIFNYLSNSLVSYQLSLKMYNEKNALLKRVSFILDILYHIILSFFIYETFSFLNIKPLNLSSFNLYLFCLNVLILFTIARYLILNVFNKLFDTAYIISEYVHNNFIINKVLGIVLYPIIFAIYYLPEKYTLLMLLAGFVLIGIGFFMKILRGYQIIIRKDILFYYLILYLCTLEILPLFIGYKVFISLL